MDNRLLNEQEINTIWATRQEGHQTCGDCRDLLTTAQLAKTDKEWVEWVENTFGNSIAEYYTEIWAERKRELKTANKINVTLQHQIDIIVRAAVHSNNKEWVEWGESLPHPDCYGKCDIKNFCNNTSCFWKNWQERKKEIGL
jgi:ribosomal protein S24E